MLRDTYVEINLDHLAYNMKNIREYIGDRVAIAAVVKANGYGHGAVEIAETIMENGGDYLAVATLTEALELRKRFPDYPVFIMGYTPDETLEYVVAQELTACIFSRRQAEILDRLGERHGKKPRIHIKYDTGFNRLGYQDTPESIAEIISLFELKNIKIEGIFSHIAFGGEDADRKQYHDFIKAVKAIESSGHLFRYRHICDSIAAIDYPEFNLDMIRPGAIIYGLKSFRKNDVELRQVMTFKTKVYHVKRISEGEGISYNFKWRAGRDSVIATVPVGYSDGYPRNMFGKGIMTVKGQRVPVVGVICMDQCMLDVTDIPGVEVGDEVIIYGDGSENTLNIEEVAKLGETNKNEIISRITRRTPRVYIKDGEIVKVLDYLG